MDRWSADLSSSDTPQCQEDTPSGRKKPPWRLLAPLAELSIPWHIRIPVTVRPSRFLLGLFGRGVHEIRENGYEFVNEVRSATHQQPRQEHIHCGEKFLLNGAEVRKSIGIKKWPYSSYAKRADQNSQN